MEKDDWESVSNGDEEEAKENEGPHLDFNKKIIEEHPSPKIQKTENEKKNSYDLLNEIETLLNSEVLLKDPKIIVKRIAQYLKEPNAFLIAKCVENIFASELIEILRRTENVYHDENEKNKNKKSDKKRTKGGQFLFLIKEKYNDSNKDLVKEIFSKSREKVRARNIIKSKRRKERKKLAKNTAEKKQN